MKPAINAIFFDLGDTLRVIEQDSAYGLAAKTRIAQLLGAPGDPEAFYHDVLEPRYDRYREWALTYFCEAPESVLWTRFLAFDFPCERVTAAAAELTYAYRQSKGRRVVAEGGVQTVKALYERGYTLGIVSDLVGVHEVDAWLDRDGLRPYFKTVQQSALCLVRKPHPAIYYYALQEAGACASNTCFVGDNLDRDIVGAKAAGLGMTVGVHYPGKKPQIVTEANRPDYTIDHMTALLNLFPPLNKEESNHDDR